MHTLKRQFLGSFLRKKRLESHYSAKYCAQYLGTSLPTYYKLEYGQVNNCVLHIKRLFKLYNIVYDKVTIDAKQKTYLLSLKKKVADSEVSNVSI